MIELRIYAAARLDFKEGVEWYNARSAAAAERFAAAVGAEIESIHQHPEQHPQWDERHCFSRVRRFPYYVAYRTFPDRVEIVAIRHTSQDSTAWTDR